MDAAHGPEGAGQDSGPGGQQVIDFREPQEPGRWRAVDDVVMGGRSSSRVEAAPEGGSRFVGDLSLDNGGGFASVRRELEAGRLAGAAALLLRVRGDDKLYRLRLRMHEGLDGPSYQAEFRAPAGSWVEVRMDLGAFEPRWRGRPVPGAPPLRAEAVTSIGFLIAEKQVGAFQLELDSLGMLGEAP